MNQVFNYLAGSLSRIFTTLQEVDDKLILYGFVAGFLLNAVLAAQMVYYWNSSNSKNTSAHKLEPAGKQAIAYGSGASSSASSGVSSGAAISSPQGKSPSTRRRG